MVLAKITIPSSEGLLVAFVPVTMISKFLLDYSGIKLDELVGCSIEIVLSSID